MKGSNRQYCNSKNLVIFLMGDIEYNTQREPLVLPAYGRYVQQMVDHLLTIEEKKERTKQAKLVLKVMASTTTYTRNVKDYEQKLWNHLHIMAHYQLDVDSGYPKPRREEVEAKPARIEYPARTKGLDFYGAFVPEMVSLLVEKCPAEQLEEKGLALARHMKRVHMEWRNENVTDEEILQDLNRLSKGAIRIELPEGETLLDAATISTTGQSKTNKNRNSKNNGLGAAQRNKRKRSKRKKM